MSIRNGLLASAVGLTTSLASSSENSSSVHETGDRISLSINSLLMMQGDESGIQGSFETRIPFGKNFLNFYGAIGEDPRFGENHQGDIHDSHNDESGDKHDKKTKIATSQENISDNTFLLGGVSVQHEGLEVGMRGLMLDNEQFGEIYGQYTQHFPEIMKGADAWLRIGITQPSGTNLSTGAHIHATDKNDFHISVLHEQSEDVHRPSGTLIHTNFSHDISSTITCFAGIEYHRGEDYGSFPYANIIDTHSPGFVPFAVPGEGVNSLIGMQFHPTNDMELHVEGLYNFPEKYWEIMTQITSKLHDNMELSGGVLFDTRPHHDPMAYVGVKLDL